MPTQNPLVEWWQKLPRALRPEPGAPLDSKAYGDLLDAMREQWTQYGISVLASVESDRRDLEREGRRLGTALLEWFAGSPQRFAAMACESLHRVRQQPSLLTRTTTLRMGGQTEVDVHEIYDEECWRLFHLDGGERLLNAGSPLRTAVDGWLDTWKQRLLGFAENPLHRPLWSTIGHRAAGGQGEVPGVQRTGLWAISDRPWLQDEYFQAAGPPPPLDGRLHEMPASSQRIYEDVIDQIWSATLSALPRAAIATYHRRQAKSTWLHARVLRCLFSPLPDSTELAIEGNSWFLQAGAHYRLWEMEHRIGDRQSMSLFSAITTTDFRDWLQLNHAVAPEVAEPVALVVGMCMDSLTAPTAIDPANSSPTNPRAAAAVNLSNHTPDAVPGRSVELIRDASVDRYEFLQSGRTWVISFRGKSTHVQHRIGLVYLRELVRQRDQDVSCSSLRVSAGLGGDPLEAGSTLQITAEMETEDDVNFATRQESTDPETVAKVRAELAELELRLQEARAAHDLPAQEDLQALIRKLEGYITMHTFQGKPTTIADSGDRDRRAVSKAIERAIGHLQQAFPELGNHMSRSVSTGNACRYAPDPPVTWIV